MEQAVYTADTGADDTHADCKQTELAQGVIILTPLTSFISLAITPSRDQIILLSLLEQVRPTRFSN